MHDTTRKLTLFLLFLPSEKYATNQNGINNIKYVFVELSLGYGMKYVPEIILLGQATEIGSRVISRLVCAILPSWRNARFKPYARYYPPLPYNALKTIIWKWCRLFCLDPMDSHHAARIRHYSLNTWRNNNVAITSKRRYFEVITSKWRRFDVITTSLLRNVSAG